MKDTKTIFIAGYSTLNKQDRIEADKMLSDLKKEGYKIEMGI